ncbi:MAG: type II toxin-antitoxin system HicB family antitoxin [Alphaproteobacteria bacterium]|nr:type II toxin-antitoxin system HicB family antitoxin [Alphaproteobacteria bacterium]
MTNLKYDIVIEPLHEDDGGGYLATVPDLFGCVSDGETPQEAMENILDAIAEWLEGNKELGRPQPEPGHSHARFLKQNDQIAEHIQKQDTAIEQLTKRVQELEHLLSADRFAPTASSGNWAYRPVSAGSFASSRSNYSKSKLMVNQ